MSGAAPDPSRSRRAARSSTSAGSSRNASAIDSSTSLETSLRPRSTSERYGKETAASSATSARVRSWECRSSRSTSPMASRTVVGSGRSDSANDGDVGNGITAASRSVGTISSSMAKTTPLRLCEQPHEHRLSKPIAVAVLLTLFHKRLAHFVANRVERRPTGWVDIHNGSLQLVDTGV